MFLQKYVLILHHFRMNHQINSWIYDESFRVLKLFFFWLWFWVWIIPYWFFYIRIIISIMSHLILLNWFICLLCQLMKNESILIIFQFICGSCSAFKGFNYLVRKMQQYYGSGLSFCLILSGFLILDFMNTLRRRLEVMNELFFGCSFEKQQLPEEHSRYRLRLI